MADFHHLDDAREIWLAVKDRFGGNEEYKKMRKTMLKQEFSEFRVSEEEGLHKGYDRSLEIDVKGGSSYGSRGNVAPTHSAFICATSTTTKMGYSDPQSHSSLITYTSDFEQVEQMDMEELDIKWQMAMLSLRINKFQKKAGRKINFNNKDSARFDRKKARCNNCLQLRHFAKECNVKKVDEKARYSAFKISKVKTEELKAMSDFADLVVNAAGSVYVAAAEFAMMGISLKKEREVKLVESLARFDKWKESSKNLAKLINSSMTTRTKVGLGFKEYFVSDEVFDLSTPSIFDPEPITREGKSLYERFVKAGDTHEVPPSITGTFMPTSPNSVLEETHVTFGLKSPTSINTSESNDFVSCDNSDKSPESKTHDFASCVSSPMPADSFSTVDVKILPNSDVKDPIPTNGVSSCSIKKNVKPPSDLCNKCRIAGRNNCNNNFIRTKTCFVCGSKSHLIKDCHVYDTVDNFPSVILKATSVPTGSRNSSASTSAGRSIPATSGNRSASIHAASIHAGRHIPAGRSNKPTPFLAGRTVPTGWINHAARLFFRPTNLYFDNVYWPGIYNHMSMNEGRWGSAVKSSAGLSPKDIGIVDSGCSRSMTGNKDKLDDFVQVKGGTVTFGGGDEFQLPDESQVVVRIPRRHDLYTFNLSDIQPEQHINCLLAKASLEESTKWHRRMTHVNFKTINKLAKLGLVEGLPLKLFTNDHNCVACNKGKQHKASYKAVSATEAVSTSCYVLNRVSITNPHNKTPYELLSGKIPNIRHLKPFGCQVTILNTSDHLGKFEGKANDGKDDTNILVGTQADDSDFECDEQVIIIPSFTFNIFSGSTVQDVSTPMKNNLDYAEELARLQRQEYEAHSAAAKHDFEFSVDTAALLPQANIEICRNLVPATGDPAGGIVPTGGVPAGSDPASSVPTGGVPAGSDPASSVPTGGVLAGSSIPVSSVPTGGVLAGCSIPVSSVPAGGDLAGSSVPVSDVPPGSFLARRVPAGGVLVGSLVFTDSAASSVPAASVLVSTVVSTDSAATSPLPPVHSLGSCAHTTRFPSPSDLGNHQHTAGIFLSFSYEDDFCADVTNLDSNVAVDPVATRRINFIHPQSQILGDLQSLVQTRSTVQKSKFEESAFLSYVQNQNRTNHADHLHCLFACFLSQLEPSSVANALADPDWVAAMQEEMQQFYRQQVWKLVPLPARKIAIGTKWILKNKRDARGIVVRNKARLVAQSHRQEEGIDYDEVFAPVARIKAIRLFLAFTSYMGFMVYQMDVKNAFLDEEIKEEVYVTQPKGFEDPYNLSMYTGLLKLYMGFIKHQGPGTLFLFRFMWMTSYLAPLTKPGVMSLSQDKYVKDMLKKFDMESVRTATTPYEVPKHKSKDEPDDAVNVHLFRSMVGSFMYLTTSRPDIMFAVSACSRHQLEAYSDSDYAGSHGDRKSTTGGCQFLGRRLISWQCKKQTVVATFSTEAEYVAAASFCGQVLLLVVQVRADDLVSAGGCTLPVGSYSFLLHPTGSYSFLLLDWFLLVVLLVHADEFVPAGRCTITTGSSSFLLLDSFLLVAMYALTHRPTMVFDSLVKQFWDTATVRTLEAGPFDIIPTIDGNEVVVTESLIRTQLQMDDENGLYEFTLHDVLDGMRAIGPPSPPSSSAEVGPTTYSRPPSPSWPPFGPADIRKGGGAFASSLPSNEAPQTPVATAVGGAEDSAALTALTLKLDECLHRVTTLENELGITKKVLGGSVLKLVTRVKRLEGLLQQRKRRLVLSDSEGEDATTTEHKFDLAALYTLLFTFSASGHVSETIPPGVRVPAATTTIPAASSVDAAVHAAAAPSPFIPTTVDKGKAPMVDDSPPVDLLSEQERVLKNLHDSQLGEELAKKIQAEQEAEFSRQQDELAQKAQVESVASPTTHGQGMSDQHHQELDVAQLIYTEADWQDMLAKIATNSALSKKLLGDDVTEDNMNERLGMLLMRKRHELAEQSRVKPMTKTQQRDYMRDFVKKCSASDHAGVPAAPSIPIDASLPAASSSDPTVIPVPDVFIAHATVSVPAEPMVHSAESHTDDPLTAPEHGSSEPTVAAPTPSSSRHRRKHIAKKWVTPIVDVADAAMIKFDNDSDNDDDPLPYAPYAGWEMVPSPLGSVHVYHNMAGHTKHFTTLRKILHMVDRTDLQRLLGAVDALYQSEKPDTFALLLWGDLHVLFQSLDDADALHFWRTQDSWRIRSWRLYPQAQVHVLEMVDGRVIYMFVDVSYPLSVGTLERMLKHGLEVSKLLVGGFSCWFSTTLQMVFSSPWFTAKKELSHHEGTALSWLVQEQIALGKYKSNPLIVGSLLKTTWSSIHHLLTNEVLTSPEQTAIAELVTFQAPYTSTYNNKKVSQCKKPRAKIGHKKKQTSSITKYHPMSKIEATKSMPPLKKATESQTSHFRKKRSLVYLSKLKTLDALPSLLNRVTKALERFAQAIESTSNKTRDHNATKATLNIEAIPTTTIVIPPITTTSIVQFQSLFLASPQKTSSKPKGELITNKGKEAISHEEAKEKESESDSETEFKLSGSMVESSKKKRIKKFDFVTKKVVTVFMIEEQTNEKKKIEQLVKDDIATKEVELGKGELIDLPGIYVVKNMYKAKVKYDKFCNKMLNRRNIGKITNYDVLARGKGHITLKVYRDDGSDEIIPNFKASDLHIGE
nr:hypothetical protein [Tanacetum cinerariifolium]